MGNSKERKFWTDHLNNFPVIIISYKGDQKS